MASRVLIVLLIALGCIFSGASAQCLDNQFNNSLTSYACTACPTNFFGTLDETGCEDANGVVVIQSCTVDADCTDSGTGVGYCVNSVCTCAPGFGFIFHPTEEAYVCDVLPDDGGSCNSNAVDPLGIDLSTSVPTFTYDNGRVALTIRSPFEEYDDAESNYATSTRIYFGDGAATDCDYPDGSTTAFISQQAATDACNADYSASNWNWPTLRACGWSSTTGASEVWTNRVWIERTYTVTQGRVATTRTVSSYHDLQITFPTELTSDTHATVQLFGGAPDLQNNIVISKVSFDTGSGAWEVELTSSTVYPYQLVEASGIVVSQHVGGVDSAIATMTVSACASVPDQSGEECIQTLTVTFSAGCDALDYSGTDYIFVAANTLQYACVANADSSATCPLDPISATPYVSTSANTIELNELITLSACPSTDIDIPNPTSAIASFQNDFDTSRVAFVQGEVLNLKLTVTASNNAGQRDTISNVEITDVSETFNAGGTALGSIFASASVDTASGAIVKVTVPAACQFDHIVCFEIDTNASPFVDGGVIVPEGGNKEYRFMVNFDVTFTQGAKRSVQKEVVLQSSAESNGVFMIRSANSAAALAIPSAFVSAIAILLVTLLL